MNTEEPTSDPVKTSDPLQAYRQPLVTATGILLGFTLNTGANWVSRAFTSSRLGELAVGISIGLEIPLYAIVLYRILNNRYPRHKADSYFRTTLFLFIMAIVIAFFLMVVIMFESFFINRRGR